MTDTHLAGTDLIAAERQRQIDVEGWTREHDQTHDDGALAWAAVCYAAPETVYLVETRSDGVQWREPWPREWIPNVGRGEPGYVGWRRSRGDRVKQLVKAGALIAAEIDRLRAQP
jgi:hypothetical protein